MTKGVAKTLKGTATIKDYDEIWDDLKALARRRA